MGLKGILTPRGVISGSWQTFNGNYNKLTNKPTLNGVIIEGDKTSEDYHIETDGGGGGGTDDYDDLNNKPKINDVTLSGNKSLDALGIQAKIGFPEDSTKYLDGEGNFTTPPSSGGNCEIIPLTSGNGTTSRTFVFSSKPLFIKFYYKTVSLVFNTDFTLVYGQDFYNYLAHSNAIQISGGSGGCGGATYNNNEITLTAGNSFGCCNDVDGQGYIFVIYE